MLRGRFADLTMRQLDVFAEDDADGLLAAVRERKSAYDHATRADAERAYGDYVDAVDAVRDALGDMRDRYAQTLDGDAADEYEAAFERAARRRWRWLA